MWALSVPLLSTVYGDLIYAAPFPSLNMVRLQMEMLSVSPEAWAFLLFIKTGHDPAEAFVLWPLEKKPSKCSKCLRLACVGSFQTVMLTLGPASAGVQSTVVTPSPCPEALLLQVWRLGLRRQLKLACWAAVCVRPGAGGIERGLSKQLLSQSTSPGNAGLKEHFDSGYAGNTKLPLRLY